jgi:ribonuclease HI/probable phosphoglycerate mutase
MVNSDMWIKTDKSLDRKFDFDGFEQAADFVNKVFDIAREMDHHPKLTNEFNRVEVSLSTHSVGGKVTQKDQAFASKIDKLFSKKAGSAGQPGPAKLFTDGGSRGNPGPSAIGYVICNSDQSVVKKYGKYIGLATNNQAEYAALVAGMEACLESGINELQIFMDSELIVNQITGKYKVKNQDLKPVYAKAKKLEGNFGKVSFEHVPRENNAVADSLVNEALDEAG